MSTYRQPRLCCPDCKRKGVIWMARSHRQDNWYCVYNDCGWNAFTRSNAKIDIDNIARLKAANPGREW